VTITTYNFDDRTDGATVATGVHGIQEVSGSPVYDDDGAQFHGAIGIIAAGAQWVRWNTPAAAWSGSVYIQPTNQPGSGSNRFFNVTTTGNSSRMNIRFQSNGTIAISDGANALLGAQSTTTWAANDTFRFDWQLSHDGTNLNIELRIFKNGNIEGTTADETMSRSTPETNPVRLRIGGHTAGWTSWFDTLRLSDQLEWIGPYAAPLAGAATGSIAWSGASTGSRTPKGAATGSIAWSGAATGEAPAAGPNTGAATGSVAWAGSATGTRMSSGAATGAVTWSGAATGTRTSSGAATGSVAWSGATTGARPSAGAATGSIAWVGSADGEAPADDLSEGAATGSISWAGSVTGTRTSSGSTSGTIAWVGSATGTRTSSGSTSGDITWSGSVTGTRTSSGSTSGTIAWAGEVTGEAAEPDDPNTGTVTGSIAWAGSVWGANYFATFTGLRTTERVDGVLATRRVDGRLTTARLDGVLTTDRVDDRLTTERVDGVLTTTRIA
jgi:hypothetical protein